MSIFSIECIINKISNDAAEQKTFLMVMEYHPNYPFKNELDVAEAFIQFMSN